MNWKPRGRLSIPSRLNANFVHDRKGDTPVPSPRHMVFPTAGEENNALRASTVRKKKDGRSNLCRPFLLLHKDTQFCSAIVRHRPVPRVLLSASRTVRAIHPEYRGKKITSCKAGIRRIAEHQGPHPSMTMGELSDFFMNRELKGDRLKAMIVPLPKLPMRSEWLNSPKSSGASAMPQGALNQSPF